MPTRSTLWAALILGSLTIVMSASQSGKPAQARVGLEWQEGHCISCPTGRYAIAVLDKVEFTSRTEAWARGVSFPVYEGLPNYTLLHTSNSGKTWSEVTRVLQALGSPVFSFIDTSVGWIASSNFVSDDSLNHGKSMRREDSQLVQTRDGGQNWAKVSDQSFDWMKFFPNGTGFGTSHSRLFKTNDSGHTWTDTHPPVTAGIERVFFLSTDVGWLTGWVSKTLFFYRTVDGGNTWMKSQLPIQVTEDLWFYDSENGWIISGAASDKEPYLFNTIDGGETWSAVPGRVFRGIHHKGTAVRFISRDMGLVFENEVTYSRFTIWPASNKLWYTTDGGAHWSDQRISYDVQDCKVFRGDVLCSATSRGRSAFGILTLHVVK